MNIEYSSMVLNSLTFLTMMKTVGVELLALQLHFEEEKEKEEISQNEFHFYVNLVIEQYAIGNGTI